MRTVRFADRPRTCGTLAREPGDGCPLRINVLSMWAISSRSEMAATVSRSAR